MSPSSESPHSSQIEYIHNTLRERPTVFSFSRLAVYQFAWFWRSGNLQNFFHKICFKKYWIFQNFECHASKWNYTFRKSFLKSFCTLHSSEINIFLFQILFAKFESKEYQKNCWDFSMISCGFRKQLHDNFNIFFIF